MKLIRFCSNLALTIFVFLSSTSIASAGLVQTIPVPEPSMLSLFAVGATIAFILKKRGK